MERGRKQMLRYAAKRRLCMRFERGDTYWYLDGKGALNFQSTVTSVNGTGKPPHRVRNKYNYIGPIVDAKVSAATQRVPSYEITPSSTDPTTIGAASLAEKVALYGYDKWRLRTATLKTTRLAIGQGGVGYALPYFDPNVGPYLQTTDPNTGQDEWVGQGEIKVLVLNGNQAYGEAGVDFDDSRWYAIERARPLEDVKETPGFIPTVKLVADASASDIPTDRDRNDNLVMVTEYFERPCPKWPSGRTITVANGKPIVDYRLIDPSCPTWWGPYPLQDAKGTSLDEPLLHRLVYKVDADTDNDLGLTWQLVDFQRTIQDAFNKLVEWKNRCLNPQMKAPVGSLIGTPDDVPGAVRYYRPISGKEPEWEQPPAVPQSLFQIIERAVDDMRNVASDQQVDPAPNLAAATLESGIEQSLNRWQSFLGDLGEWHSRLMRHCLLLVARHYTEPRLLEVRGLEDWEPLAGFQGADLLDQVSCRVLPASLTPITRAGIQQQLTWINQNFPGFLNPEAAIAALQAGNIDRLTRSYWLDVSRANNVIQKIKDGSVLQMPDRTDTMPDGTQQQAPSFMPSPVDNLAVWKSVFGDWMKTDEFERLPPEGQEVGNLVWSGIQQLETQRAQQQLEQQNQIAMAQGAQNAARPQVKGMPSLPGSSTVPAAR